MIDDSSKDESKDLPDDTGEESLIGLYFTVLTSAGGEQNIVLKGLGLDFSFRATAKFAETGSSWGKTEYKEASVCYCSGPDDIFEIARFNRGSGEPVLDYRAEWQEELEGR